MHRSQYQCQVSAKIMGLSTLLILVKFVYVYFTSVSTILILVKYEYE